MLSLVTRKTQNTAIIDSAVNDITDLGFLQLPQREIVETKS